MAYGVNAPFGLRPIGGLIGSTWTGKTNPYNIRADADGTSYPNSIFTGDLVFWGAGIGTTTAGTVVLAANAIVNSGPVGVFLGCEYYDTTNVLQKRSYWSASTRVFPGSKITALINDDPTTIYEIQASTSTNVLADAIIHPYEIGCNSKFVVGGGGGNLIPNNPAIGNIHNGISAGFIDGVLTGTEATKELKIIGYSENTTQTIYDSAGNVKPFLNVRVILNVHAYKSSGTIGTTTA